MNNRNAKTYSYLFSFLELFLKESIFGLVGVIIGAGISWGQAWWVSKQERNRHANYFAIRVVHALRRYAFQCSLVATDDGLVMGQRDEDGCLSPQAADPGPIRYPDDIDWKSIAPKIVNSLLSLQSQAEAADRIISSAAEICGPPDFEDAFEARQLQYSMIGLNVLSIEKELCKIYKIPAEDSLEDWNPSLVFEKTIKNIEESQIRRSENLKEFFQKTELFSKKKKD